MTSTTSTTPVADGIAEFNTGFAAQVPAELGAVFAGEQADLRAAGVPEGAVRPGDRLPAVTLLDLDGADVDLVGLLAGRPGVVVLYRGTWCPYCNVALATYQRELLPALQERGVPLVAVSPQRPDASAGIVEKNQLAFPVLSDPGNALAGALGVVTEPSAEARRAQGQLGFDVADSNADGTARVPFPTVLVVDGAGVVRYADVHVDYTTRTEPAEVLAAVDALA